MIGMRRNRFSVTPWQGDRSVAYLRVRDSSTAVDAETIARHLEHLASSGYRSVITPALHPEEARAYFANGFEEFDSLIVLGHTLDDVPARSGANDAPHGPGSDGRSDRPTVGGTVLRRARRRDLPRVFELDRRAFPPQWRLDRNGLVEARRATTHVHFRVAEDGPTGERTHERVIGYAISGRTGPTAFLQRLAVDPDHSGRGTGSALVVDGLRWAARHRCSNLLVNTQTTNHRALGLYERLGFVRSSTRLVVLRCEL